MVSDAAAAIAFYERALGAHERLRMHGPDGKRILHAELQIGDSIVFVADEVPDSGGKSPTTLGGVTGGLHLYVEHTDQLFQRAVQAGAKVVMPPTDMFWGDRYARIADPFGHEWGIATHIEDVPPAEAGRRGQEFYRRASEQAARA
ncbi:MAG TPA: VOC family protein [Thermoplasmata archaeon]|nr:VOC family protein [Thermoplasmata archaeon]